MIMHRLERIHGLAEHASKPGNDVLPLEPLTPRRILGTADVLDHGEIAQAQNPARTAFSVGHGPDLYRSTAEAAFRNGDRPGPTVETAEAFRGRFPEAS
jgi:hypothetical protein